MGDFAERLEKLIKNKFRSKTKFATKIGRPPSTVYSWLPNKRSLSPSRPSDEDFELIAEALDVSVAYLLTGDDGLLGPKAIAYPGDLDKVIYINLINVSVGAGNGHYVHSEEIIDVLEISKFFLRAYGLSEPYDCSAVTVVGPSMEPLLRSGDIVIVDHTQKKPLDAMYVVRVEGDVMVKHVARLQGRMVRIYSETLGFPVYEFPIDSSDFAIIGRVVWGGRRF